MRAPAWFATRSPREKRLILVMLALMAVVIVWAGIVLPVRDALSSARTRHADAAIRLGRAMAAVDAVKAIQRAGATPLAGPLAAAVRSRAGEAGFTLATLDEDGPDRVRLTIATARPAALLAWAAALEREGMLIEALALTPNGDATVGVAMTLRGRGA